MAWIGEVGVIGGMRGTFAVAAAVLVMAGVASSRAGQHGSAAGLLCRPYQHIVVTGARHSRYVVRNDNYGGRPECLRNTADGPNFAVATSGAHTLRSEPVAFPNIFRGCSWGVCSPRSGLPRRVSRLRTLVTSWSTRQRAGGIWSVGYDIWFARHRAISGQDQGAEMMIWLNARGISASGAQVVTIDHLRWQVVHWRTGNGGKHWNYVRFSLVGGASAVRNLDLRPFIALAQQQRLIDQHWWLTSVEAGFEIWRGGAGLRTTGFSVRV